MLMLMLLFLFMLSKYGILGVRGPLSRKAILAMKVVRLKPFLDRGNPGALLRSPGRTCCCKKSAQSRTDVLLLPIGADSLEQKCCCCQSGRTVSNGLIVVAIGADSLEHIRCCCQSERTISNGLRLWLSIGADNLAIEAYSLEHIRCCCNRGGQYRTDCQNVRIT